MEKHAGKVCFSLPVKPHSSLILFYSSNPTHTNRETISGCLSAVREFTTTARCLFLFQSRSPLENRNAIFHQKYVTGVTLQCYCQEKLMSINSHSSLFTPQRHTLAQTPTSSNLQLHQPRTYSTTQQEQTVCC